jgi:hypothetical protein
MKEKRKKNLKVARTLQIWNVIYDVIEVVVSLIAGITANSSALIGWGLDSTIEVVSAGTLGWRLHGEIKGVDEEKVKRRQKNHAECNRNFIYAYLYFHFLRFHYKAYK